MCSDVSMKKSNYVFESNNDNYLYNIYRKGIENDT